MTTCSPLWYINTMVRRDEHDYIRIGNDIKAGSLPGLVILQGIEEYLVDFYTDAIIKKFVNEASKSLDVVELDRETLTVDEVIENLETVSLLSDRKVVVIKNFIDARGKYPKNLQKTEKTEVEAYESFCSYVTGKGMNSGIPDGALLILTVAKQDEDAAARKRMISDFDRTFAKAGNVYDFAPLNSGQLRGFIEKRLNASGKKYKSSLVWRIADESGYNNKNIDYGLYELDNDIKKIIAHSGSRDEINDSDVADIITANPENDIFGLIDAIGARRKDRALELLNNLITKGANEYQILALLTNQLELMLMTKEMGSDGMNMAAIKEEMKATAGVHEFKTQKACQSASHFSVADLRKILSAAYDIDMHIKSGLYDGKLALEMFITGV